MNRLVALLNHGRVRLTLPLAHRLIGDEAQDTYLVSFPRSGSTWLRTIVINALYPEADSNPEVFNRLFPGVSILRLGLVRRAPRPRLISTHALRLPVIKRPIYLVRDGRDAVVSYYHYTITRQNRELTFEHWLDGYLLGHYGPRWDQHVESWLGQQATPEPLKVLRFERLKAEPLEVVKEFFACTALEGLEEARMVTAIANASIEKGRKWEAIQLGGEKKSDASFYRGGKTGQWQSYLTPALEARFMEVSAGALRLAGYDRAE